MPEKPQLSIVNHPEGNYITIEGKEKETRFFIVQKGSVGISNSIPFITNKKNSTLGPGDFFGVIAAMSGFTQIETTMSLSAVELVVVDKSQFEGLIRFNTPIAMKIIQQFSRRVRQLNSILTELTRNAENADEDVEILYKNALYYMKEKKMNRAFYCFKRYVECFPSAENVQKARVAIKALISYNKPGFKVTSANESVRLYPKGNLICSEGEFGEEMFIIQSGMANVFKIVNGMQVVLSVIKAGDIFGEMCLLEAKPRSASVVVLEDCLVTVITKQNFELMVSLKPQIIGRITQMLAERIWFMYKQIANAAIKDPVARFFDVLCIQMERDKVVVAPFTQHIFNFNVDQFMKMANIEDVDKRKIVTLISEDNKFKIVSDKLLVTDVMEIIRLNDFYKKQSGRNKNHIHGYSQHR
ncbi:MAG: cyclic nucleotide-binding domain-containing protein [Spirochaetaceae bacterium]|jgi:CRP-like cAMP-binding protein|nr:cyclic nucleotide-binding domain-containing protein [Spirochaetaceae bacterium]